MFGAILTSIVSGLFVKRGEIALTKIFTEPPFRAAIASTEEAFPQHSIDSALNKWCQSESFAQLLTQIRGGNTTNTDEQLINSFIEVSEFDDGANTRETARSVLESYASNLQTELYKSDEGLDVHARRTEQIAAETRAETRSGFAQQQDFVSSQLAQHQNAVLQHMQTIVNESKSAEVKEAKYDARIDTAGKFIKDRKPKAAQSILLDLRNELHSHDASKRLRFRVAANLGSCALHLDDFVGATREYEAALGFEPEDRQVLSNLAVAKLASGDHENALVYSRRARPAGETSPVITANHLRVLYFSGEASEVDQLIEDEQWIINDPDCLFVLALIRGCENDYVQAEVYLRKLVQQKPDNPHVHNLLAQTIAAPIQQAFRSKPNLPWLIPRQDLDRLEAAALEFDLAIKGFEEDDNTSPLLVALRQRALVRGTLNRNEDALRDCNQILAHEPNDAPALTTKAHLLFLTNKTDEAMSCLAAISGPEDLEGAAIAMATIYQERDEPDKVIGLLSRYWEPEDQQRRQLSIADCLVWAYRKKGDQNAIDKINSQLETKWGDDLGFISLKARWLAQEGKRDQAFMVLESAMARASEAGQRNVVILELAELYYQKEDWARSAELYGQVVDKSTNNPLLVRYLLSSFNAGAFGEVLGVTRSLRANGPAIPFISELEARVLMYASHLDPALGLFQQLEQQDPGNVQCNLWIASLQDRLGHHQEARQTIENIDVDKVKDNAGLLMQLASSRRGYGLPGWLPLAYRARRLAFNKPEMHLAYFGLFTSREREDQEFNPTQVSLDCAVHLNGAGGTRVVTIVDQEAESTQRDEVDVNSTIAKKLWGLKVGAKVILKQTALEELSYTITRIQSKYVYAFQETGDKFSSYFPEHDGLSKVDVSNKDFSKVFAHLDRRYKQGQEVLGIYREQHCPLNMIARMMRVSYIDMWLGLVHGQHCYLYTSSGNPAQSDAERKLLAKEEAIVLGLSALVTLWYLDLLDALPKLFRRILVTQAVLDEVNKLIDKETFTAGKDSKIIWSEGGRYSYQEITEDQQARKLRFLETIREFVETQTERPPTLSILEMPKETVDEMKEVLGDDAILSILLAKEARVPLYIDDYGLSCLAKNEWQVQTVETRSIIERMRSRGILSLAQAIEALRRLILGNYAFIMINSYGLMWILRLNEYKPTAEMRRILSVLSGPDCDERSAIMVGAEFLHKLWLEVGPLEDRLALIDQVLDSVSEGRVISQVLPMLRATLPARFRHSPKALPIIFTRIDSRLA